MSKAAPFLADFRVLRPAYSAGHEESVAWLSRAHARAEADLRSGEADFDADAFQRTMERHVRRFGCPPESLARRGHDLPDFLHYEWGRMHVFDLERSPSGAGMGVRMRGLCRDRRPHGRGLLPRRRGPAGRYLHVTCTGYVAPSAAQKLLVKRGWQARTGSPTPTTWVATPDARGAHGRRLPGLGSGPGASLPSRRVDILHAESAPCIWIRPPPARSSWWCRASSPTATFATAWAPPGEGPALAFLGSREALVPGSLEAMGWTLGDRGMRMSLARECPS